MQSEEESIFDRESGRRERFVPLHTTDLVEFLAQHPSLSRGEHAAFRQLASLILALLHHIYRQRHEQLTYIYAPLDPDRDTLMMSVPIAEQRERLCEEFLKRLDDALRRANYTRLTDDQIKEAMAAASRWGVRMRVDFESLRTIRVYARGNVNSHKLFRSWQTLYRLKSIDVPLYQRLVVIFRTHEQGRDKRFEWRRMYLRMFKNIPQQDVDMVLPATRIKWSIWDHSSIVLPSLYALVSTLWRMLRYVALLTVIGIFKAAAFGVLFVVAFLYGLKSAFTSTVNTRRRYNLNVAQNLYFQSLDNNAGAMLRLLEEGEQQEACESVLAYFTIAILMRDEDGVSLKAVDRKCEEIVLEATGVSVDFDIESAARDLLHLGILRACDNRWYALPLAEANRQLDRTWDQWFNED